MFKKWILRSKLPKTFRGNSECYCLQLICSRRQVSSREYLSTSWLLRYKTSWFLAEAADQFLIYGGMSQWDEVIVHLPSARFVISSGGGFGMFSTTVPWQAHRYDSPILYVRPLPWLSVRRGDELSPIREGPGKWRVGHREHSLGSMQKARSALARVVPGPYNSNHGLFFLLLFSFRYRVDFLILLLYPSSAPRYLSKDNPTSGFASCQGRSNPRCTVTYTEVRRLCDQYRSLLITVMLSD